jgi:2-methylcitrate dehydratase PrpD
VPTAAKTSLLGATRRLGQWIAQAPNDWSDTARGRATNAFIDTAACLLAGADDPAPRKVRDAAAGWGAGTCVIAGTPHRMAAPWAALVNGTAAHALDYDDVLEIGNAHVSAALVPALLALGEERRANGAACIDAFIVGVEVLARLGEAMNMTHYFKGWHTTLTLGAPATAAACARLLKLDTTRATAAISLATSLASGAKRQFGTMTKPLHAGLAAKNGIIAAVLAESGVTAADDVYEGDRGFVDLFADVPASRLEAALNNLGAPAAIEGHGLWQKFYPCCASAHRPLDALLALKARKPVVPAEITRIDASIAEVAAQNLTYADPTDAMQARFSLHYLLGSALVDGRLALDAFSDQALARPDVRALLSKIHMAADPEQPGAVNVDEAPQRATVALHLTDGTVRSETVTVPKGHPRAPLSRDELYEKFSACAAPTISVSDRDTAYETLENLSAVGDLSKLTRPLGTPHA